MSINWQEAKRAAEQGVAAEAAKQVFHHALSAVRGPAERGRSTTKERVRRIAATEEFAT